jgi:prepilin signal peptidase PulO-like enzyme (type II secretory pathway)
MVKRSYVLISALAITFAGMVAFMSWQYGMPMREMGGYILFGILLVVSALCLCCQTKPDQIDSYARTLAETNLWRVCLGFCILDVGLCAAASRNRFRWLRTGGTAAVVRHRLLDPDCSINSGD